MASFFNMKGTTQSEFSIGAKGPKLKKYVTGDTITNEPNAPFLLLPITTLAEKIYLDHTNTNKYIDKTNYTGNAATATKLTAKNIGLAIQGITIVHTYDNNKDGKSDGSDLIRGYVTAIDASKLALGANNAGIPYSVISGLVVGGDLSDNDDDNKIAASNHTHTQYLSTESFTITTKDGETVLGQIKIDNETESYSVTGQTAKLALKLRDSSVLTANLNDSAVTTAKINNGAVTYEKLKDGEIQPAKLKTIASGYTADYSNKIGIVQSAHNLLDDGKIAGINISDFLVVSNSAYTNKVKNAETADYATNLKSGNTTKAALNVINATNKVEAASTSASNGNIVLWSSDRGISGDITGNAATATSAGKLTTAATLWGNSFTGENGQKIGSSSTAADIQYTGNITPRTSGGGSLGTTDLRYSNLYITDGGTVYAGNISVVTKATIKKIEISSGTDDTTYGIDLNGHNISEVNTLTAKIIEPYGTSGTSVGTSTNAFKAMYIDAPEHFHWSTSGTDVTLKGALDNKSDITHTHAISSAIGVAPDNTGYITLANGGTTATNGIKIATSTHKHKMSDITDIAGVYQFKGTVESVTQENGNIIVSLSSTPQNGDVYNVLASFVYKEKTYPAGTNIVYEIDKEGDPAVDVGRWKPLGGVFDIDLDDFVTEISGSTFRSTGWTDADHLTWSNTGANNPNNVAGTITTNVWYKARVQNKSGTFQTVLPRATTDTFGLIRLGYNNGQADTTGRNYPITVDESSGRAYVNVAWVNRDHIETYNVSVNSTSRTDQSNAASIPTSSPVYINLLHTSQFNENANTNGAVSTTVAKSILVAGSGQAKIKYEQEDNNVTNGTLTVDVPKRAGYPIPVINCTDTPSISGNDVIFNAATTSGTGNGVHIGANDEAVIKNNSLVILYINHTEKVYEKYTANSGVKYKVSIPASYFTYDQSAMKENNETLPANLVFDVVYKSNLFNSPDAASFDNMDLSRKYYLAYISRGITTFGRGSTRSNVIVILDDIGADIDSVEAPSVYYDYANQNIKLRYGDLNKLKSIIRRYTATSGAKVYLRTYCLNGNNTYVPLTVLDHEISSSIADGHEVYTKNTLLNNLIDANSTSSTLNKVHFNNDSTVPSASIRGLAKICGNIDLDTFSQAAYIKEYTRDYTKLRFQYVIKMGSFELGGKMSYDDVTISKEYSHVLPAEYQEVEYLESTGTQYIDAEISAPMLYTSNFEVSCEFSQTQQTSSEQALMSVWTSTYGYWNYFIHSSNKLDLYLNEHKMCANTLVLNKRYTTTVKRINNTWTFGTDGDTVSATYNPASAQPNDTSIKLFTRGDTPTTSYSDTHIKMYWATIKCNNMLVREFIPCYRKSDNSAGMYDLVTGRFFANSGTGAFIAGGSVVYNNINVDVNKECIYA